MEKSLVFKLFSLVGVIALAGSMAVAQDAAPSNGPRTDGQIEMDVVHALDAEQTLKNDLITAATIQGEVTLAGTVASDSSKKLAESVVTKVPGVTKVHNNLTVGNPQEAQNAQQQSPQDSTDYGPPSQADTEPGAQPGPDYGQAPPPPQGYPQSGQPTDQGQYPQQGRSPQPG